MRKLSILKAIVDFIWIITIPIAAPLTIIFIIMIHFDDFSALNFSLIGIELELSTTLSKILMTLLGICFLLQMYSLHIFRKVLDYFKRVKIFDDFVIAAFHKIGILLITSGVFILLVRFLGKLYLHHQISLSLGIHPYLIIIVLGLFFQVLSEIFKMAKKTKQENDLTI